MIGEPQGCSCPPRLTASRMHDMAATSRPAPRKSIWRLRRWNGTRSALFETTRAAIPKGTLTKKIQRQELLSTMKPPKSGPATLAKAQVAAM